MKIPGLYESPQTIFPIFDKKGPVAPEVPAVGFVDEMKKALQSVDSLQKDADQQQRDLVVGKAQSLHEVMISMEKASVAMELTIAVRTLLVDGYREIMRMQV